MYERWIEIHFQERNFWHHLMVLEVALKEVFEPEQEI